MDIDWQTLFVPRTALLELMLRGTIMYFALLAVLRVLVRRHVGAMSLMDLLLMVLIADAAQNAMADEYRSLTEGLVLCGTLIGWNYLLDWLSYLSPTIQKLLEPPPLPIIRDGKLLRRHMRQELITEDELMSLLRQQGVDDPATVKLAYVEPDGGISVFGPQAKGQPLKKRNKSATPV
jgi:uncharacterized membrane protein YcaP (DUF421 family)